MCWFGGWRIGLIVGYGLCLFYGGGMWMCCLCLDGSVVGMWIGK